MKICTNCGTLNPEERNLCKNCGAILPISSENPELRISLGSASSKKEPEPIESAEPKQNNHNSNHQLYGEQSIFMGKSDKNGGSKNKNSGSDSQEKTKPSSKSNTQQQTTSNSNGDWDQSIQESYYENQREFLEEIEPAPFNKSFLDSDSKKPQEIPHSTAPSKQEQRITQSPGPKASDSANTQTTISISPEKRKRLEKDMKDVLSFLTEQLPTTQKSINKEQNAELSKKRAQVEQNIKPETINDILKQLLKIDRNIEASAIIQSDGKKLASAISDRISDPLFGTIGQNLSMIGSDIINGLNAGVLRSISVRGTEGVLDLAPVSQDDPILKDLILIIFSNPSVRSGMIQIAIRKMSKQLKEFL
ncbi:MAG: hypothetical protein EU547_02255 [Promethearchaeota archaeon]|nr:MAG: hypothetical protein EU547_02255 [Candidatus Lokiarchaeota archaeon]